MNENDFDFEGIDDSEFRRAINDHGDYLKNILDPINLPKRRPLDQVIPILCYLAV